ncbi:MAG TPA: class I poly(R)-hydroxyalkanoic acid synthase [Casimicrobiaceae bacterium]
MSSTVSNLPAAWVDLAQQWQHTLQQWSQWWLRGIAAPGAASAPPAPVGAPLPGMPFDPAVLAALNEKYRPLFESLWNGAQAALASSDASSIPEVASPAPGDRRFTASAWREQPYFAYIKQAYLLYARYLGELAALANLPPDQKKRLQFATRQYVDALAPTNFPATNPEVLQRAVETDGGSLMQGLANLLQDVSRGRITMSDETAFEVGRNLAITPGSVVFRNELIELIQYDAATPTVYRRPLLMVPPCINKYYILDLTPDDSFVRHSVGQGHTTFMISWRNIPAELGALTWDDYLQDGVLAAIRAVRAITGSRAINALGFCVGGTLLACALAVLAARKDDSVSSVTLLTTMLDFGDPGDVGVYISPEALAAREPALCAGARLPGSELANAFASLRANELVWSYVVNNYLKGRTPAAFDLLYWNGDSANLPGPMYVYYLREMYIGNRLREPGALTMLGEPVDLRRIAMPAYVYGSRDDHIVPWRAAYRTASLLGGDMTFVLGASGHIAGVVNPPMPVRRNYWRNERITDDPDEWLARAVQVPGSWWTHWDAWIAAHAGRRRRAPAATGSAAYPPLMPAPGSYVVEKVSG